LNEIGEVSLTFMLYTLFPLLELKYERVYPLIAARRRKMFGINKLGFIIMESI